MSELPRAGDRIGDRYQIESLLGQGGMGAVFAAINGATGRAVAIKWMLPGAARSRESIARFLAEARATARIEHPNVIQVFDVGQDGDSPYLVMERLRGQSLADRLKSGRLSVPETLEVIIPSCKGLLEAHNEGIIHRDIKPDNIFLCQGKDGSKRPPKVLDFGISKLYDQDGGPALTKTGMAMGTPWYMSPEQLNAPPDADARFDVYAIGVVMYECLTGRPPYNAEGLFELVQQIAAGNPTPIRLLAPDVPPELEAIAMRSMHVRRDQRYPSMRELIVDLESFQVRLRGGAYPDAMAPSAAMANAPPTGGYSPAPMSGGVAPTGAMHTGPGHRGAYTPAHGHIGQGFGQPPSAAGVAVGAPLMHPGSAQRGGGALKWIIGGIVALLGLGMLAIVGVGIGFVVFGGDDSSSGGGITNPLPTGGGGGINPLGTNDQDNNPRDPDIELTFSGACSPTWSGRRMVTGGPDSLNVMSSTLGGLTGSIMMNFPNETGTIQLSTEHRTRTQSAINVMVGQALWTNMTMDLMAVRRGRIPDPVSGTVILHSFDSELATADIEFQNVNLQSMRDGTICTVNGRLRTYGTTYGM